ncbi:hypothetical protein SAMN05216275_10983 [Streptosporangium canum]|uniref:Uncharacterized protein n=1 Tax=Streptosporangium canum TaxID=324952 RepID=A0A1I3RK88_9ACTN|nr:hypothetical protein [Streptosporangium canum]SFJ47034.1 hypothetical protein SAMN05216275_10983 [Streptosporangium canum]
MPIARKAPRNVKEERKERASAWLAAFVIGLPALGLVAVIVALRGRS